MESLKNSSTLLPPLERASCSIILKSLLDQRASNRHVYDSAVWKLNPDLRFSSFHFSCSSVLFPQLCSIHDKPQTVVHSWISCELSEDLGHVWSYVLHTSGSWYLDFIIHSKSIFKIEFLFMISLSSGSSSTCKENKCREFKLVSCEGQEGLISSQCIIL